MADCDAIKLLIGPFTDGELEPHEMEEVALHIVTCVGCKATLEDYRTLAVTLRDIAPIPALDGFAASVRSRIDEIPLPLRLRMTRWFDALGERVGVAIALGAVSAAAAVLAVMIATPLMREFVAGRAPSQLAAAKVQNENTLARASAIKANTAIALNNDSTSIAKQADAAADSQAVISSLESQSPSVAVWNEPHTGTTVIWVPDQP